MSRLIDMIDAVEAGKNVFEDIIQNGDCCDFVVDEIYGSNVAEQDMALPGNRIAAGDNLKYMEYMIKKRGLNGKLQLIYADPPFFSNGKYQASVRIESELLGRSPLIKTGAYDDTWDGDFCQYLKMLAVRFYMMKELLSDTGCLCVHLDWHAVHYVKVILDEIFGENNFVNEIIWTYKSGGATKRSFARKHDTILFYSKTDKYTFNPQSEKSYNRGLKPYRFKGVEEYQDDIGWYTVVNMKDVWNIDMVGRTSAERTGYATQKPEKLLERVVKACSNEGDLCADFFAGSGTLGAVCGKLNRGWILCDNGDVATSDQIYRMAGCGYEFAVERIHDEYAEKSYTTAEAFVRAKEGELVLADLQMDIKMLCCSSDKIVENYYSLDRLSMVRFWGADTDYDGRIFRINNITEQKSKKIQIKNNSGHQRIAVVGYNVFGGRFTAEVII